MAAVWCTARGRFWTEVGQGAANAAETEEASVMLVLM